MPVGAPNPAALAGREQMFEQMLLVRRFEEAALERHRIGEVPGPLHLSLGQEAVAVGACAPLEHDDVIASTHRGHHHCLAKGMPPDRMMAELMGRQAGWARGRGGSMHLVAPEVGVLGTNGIVGGGLPIAVGAAYAFRTRDESRVAMCFFGEGAVATGAFGEALNLAALWDLPIVFLCENNQHVEFGRVEDHVAGRIFERASSYGFPGVEVDGNNVGAVRDVATEAVARARSGAGPTLIEALTFRWSGHHADDRALYRSPEELEAWQRERDPIARLALDLDPALIEQVGARVDSVIAAAVAYASASPPTDLNTLSLDHYDT